MVNEMETGVVRRYVGIMKVELGCQNMVVWDTYYIRMRGTIILTTLNPIYPLYPSMKRHPVIS